MAGIAWLSVVDPSPPAETTVAPAPEASPAARTLLGDLGEGDNLVGWTVLSVDGPRDGVVRVDLGRDRVRFALMVARKGTQPQAAPLETERYCIFYGHADPPETRLPANTIRATTNALAHRIRAHEATVEVDGM